MYVGGLYTQLLYSIIPTLFPNFCYSTIPTLLHFLLFLYISVSTCHSDHNGVDIIFADVGFDCYLQLHYMEHHFYCQ